MDEGHRTTQKSTASKVESKSGFLVPIEYPELVFGLVGALGSNLSQVGEILQQELSKVGYRSSIIRVSSLLHEIKRYSALKRPFTEEKRIEKHMDKGNDFREKLGRGDALALLSIAALGSVRKDQTGHATDPAKRFAYILRSFKHPDEIKTLREVYGRSFIQISCYSPKLRRRDSITSAIAKSHHDANEEFYCSIAEKLIDRDQAELSDIYGQNVRETFPSADVIINAENRQKIRRSLSRFIEILFSHPFHTPSVDEYGMFFAKAAALRSSDFSRQVGAVIMSEEGEVVSVGCNEVPKAGGGFYWPDDPGDLRDFCIGSDPSVSIKQDILGDILSRLKERKWLSSEKKKRQISQLVSEALTGAENPLIRGAQLMDILEFGRIVHAEMAALCDAARKGTPVKGTTLYCTTFPCHICARHIVASGIKRVVYIEPYPKSKAAKLYPDSISVDKEGTSPENTVKFDSFIGVSPIFYSEYFEAVERKTDSGEMIDWKPENARPRFERLSADYIDIETGLVTSLYQKIKEVGLTIDIQ